LTKVDLFPSELWAFHFQAPSGHSWHVYTLIRHEVLCVESIDGTAAV
jgi:hypothetical protein